MNKIHRSMRDVMGKRRFAKQKVDLIIETPDSKGHITLTTQRFAIIIMIGKKKYIRTTEE